METDAQINQGLDARTNATEYLSIHSAFSDTGANELSGGAYARTQIEWDAASGRVADNTNQEVVQIPAGSTVRWLGRWSASSAGTFYGMVPNGSTTAKVAVGLDTDTFYCAAHGFSNDDKVTITRLDNAVPTGVTEGDVYYVISSTTDTFQISTSSGGAAVNVTASHECIVSDIIEESFVAQGQIILNAGAFDLLGLA